MEARSQKEQAILESKIKQMFEQNISFNQHLGFKVHSLGETVEIKFDMQPELIGHFLHGRLHGGVTSAVLDTTGGLAVMWAIAEYHKSESATDALARFKHLGTIDLRVDYLRQGIGQRFIASATIARLGRRVATAHMRLENEEQRLIATGAATYIVNQ